MAPRVAANEGETLPAAVLFAASTSCLYYAPHLFPYAVAMTFGLLARHAAAAKDGRWRSWLACGGWAACAEHERSHAGAPLSGGPFRGFLDALHRLQEAFPTGQNAPIRTALVTARSVPAHERVIRTLRDWGIRLDEALFLGGRAKGPFLEAFGADIFFDDSEHNIVSARDHVAAGHVPHGIANR